MDDAAIIDRMRGTLFGQAIGDALGLGTEFLPKWRVAKLYPNGLRSCHQIVKDRHRERWESGDWTDDTDQMLCILDSLVEKRKVEIVDIAAQLKRWMDFGLQEFGDDGGLGMGTTVRSVLRHPDFLCDPHGAARAIWNKSNQKSASNGAVMRTSILGLFCWSDNVAVAQNAERVCKITHFDPRCVASCVAVSVAISMLVRGAELEEVIDA